METTFLNQLNKIIIQKTVVKHIDNTWSLDLLDEKEYRNNLVLIDIFGEVGWCFALNKKTAANLSLEIFNCIYISNSNPRLNETGARK